MNVVKTGFFVFCVFFLCLGTASADTMYVSFGDVQFHDFYKSDMNLDPDGVYRTTFQDTFVFTLTDFGSVSFELWRNNENTMSEKKIVHLTSIAFENGESLIQTSFWEPADPNNPDISDQFASFTTELDLAAGTYNLLVEGFVELKGGDPDSYGRYLMTNINFFQGQNPNPVPEPATMMLLGAGLLGLAGTSRMRKRK